MNQGQAIESFMNSSLDMRGNDTLPDYDEFNSSINDKPHGAMHLYIGGAENGLSTFNKIFQVNHMTGLMTRVESAGFDPIFWVHHANIDYLWWRWELSAFGQRPVLAELQSTPTAYAFFDENGNPVTLTVEQAFNQAFNMDYTYDAFLLKVKVPLPFSLVPQQIDTLATTKPRIPIPIPVEAKPIQVTLPIAKRAPQLRLIDRTKSRLQLAVTITFTKEPQGIYELYVNSSGADSTHLVGVMTFFGAAHMKPEGKRLTKTFHFTVNRQVDLAAFTGKLNLLVVPKGHARDSIAISEVTLLSKEVAPR